MHKTESGLFKTFRLIALALTLSMSCASGNCADQSRSAAKSTAKSQSQSKSKSQSKGQSDSSKSGVDASKSSAKTVKLTPRHELEAGRGSPETSKTSQSTEKAGPVAPSHEDESFQMHLIQRQNSSGTKSDGGTENGAASGAAGSIVSGAYDSSSSTDKAPVGSQGSSSSSPGPSNSAASVPLQPVTKKIAEDGLKLELRDIHECLRRVEGALGEIKREADRRQMVVADPMQNDLGVMDPWATACPGMMPYEGQPEMVGGPYLPPRTKFLKHSCDHLDSTFAALSESIDKLPQLVTQSNSFTDPLDIERAKADSDILKDSTLHLGIKFGELRKICTIGEPDNVSLLRAVKEFDGVLKGMDEAAKRLWKDENPDTKN